MSPISEIEKLKRAVLLKRLEKRDGVRNDQSGLNARIERVDRLQRIPLSWAQQRLWFLDTLSHEGGSAYFIATALRLKGDLNYRALSAALDRVVERHEALRTTFDSADGQPFQVIANVGARFTLVEVDVSTLEKAAQKEAIAAAAEQEAQTPLNLRQGPLVRGRLLKLASDHHVLMLTQHHINSDGWSSRLLMHELSVLYAAYCTDSKDPLPLPPIQYADYASWQRRRMEGGALQTQIDFWKKQLIGVPALLDLPTDRPRPSVQSHRGAEIAFEFAPGTADNLRALAKRHGATLFMTLLAGWSVLLSRLSGQSSVVVGTMFANRQRPEVVGVIGFFANTLALHMRLDADLTVAELLAQAKTSTLDAYDNQDVPFEQVVEAVNPQRSLAYSPLFQAMLTLNNNMGNKVVNLPGLELEAIETARFTAHFDLNMSLHEGANSISGVLVYASDLFDRSTMERLLIQFQTVLGGMVADDSQAVSRLPLLTVAERAKLLMPQSCRSDLAPALQVHALFEARVAMQPDAIALYDDQFELSYRDLNCQSNQLAHLLIERGLCQMGRVGVCLERGPLLLVAMLAVLKAGGTYLPLDPSYPAERIGFLLEDSAPFTVLTQQSLISILPDMPATLVVLDTEENTSLLERQPSQDAERPLPPNTQYLAYIIYTSGSTGRPKGVANTAAGLINRLQWFGRTVLDKPPITAMRTSIGFVDSVTEILDTLLAGGTLVVFDKQTTLDVRQMVQRLQRFNVSNVMMVPSLLGHLLDLAPQAFTSIRNVICSGERLSAELAARFVSACPQTRLYNMYGCSEVNGDATAYCYPQSPNDIHFGRSVIGRALPNTCVYVLDHNLEPVPTGITGEIYIGGIGIASGYINRPELDAERFIAHPFGATDERLYKTGDLGRWLPDDVLEYLGRNDFQVKLRGFRIEPGEIEARLLSHPQVKECVVVVHESEPGDKRLAAYVVPSAHEADEQTSTIGQLGFSLFYFGAEAGTSEDRYRLYTESARFADTHGFEAIWTPERHFNEVAGLYPNPSLLSAALAMITSRVHLRAGSVVLPLHQPIRVAEEWSVVDNLSHGRAGVAIASGWHPRDFVLMPENYKTRREVMLDGVETLKSLWRGDAVPFRDGEGEQVPVAIFPKPIQRELPLWLTVAGNPETFIEAGRIGANVLTHLLGQTIEEVGEKIALYRKALAKNGHDPATRRVTLMVHTYVGAELDATLAQAREPFNRYMRAHLGLIGSVIKSLKLSQDQNEENIESITEFAFERYSKTASLIGTPESCMQVVERLREIDVDEIACLFDWMNAESAISGLPHLHRLQQLARNAPPSPRALRQHVMQVLPEYMVPASITLLDRLPLTASGKVDRIALPTLNKIEKSNVRYEAPCNTDEVAVAHLWQQLLRVDQVGRNSHFFELGGHSILAAQMVSYASKLLGVEAPLRQLFAHPTMGAFVEAIKANSLANRHPNLAAIRKSGTQRPLFLIHPGQGEIGYVQDLAPWIDADVPVYGLAATGFLDGESPLETVEEMATRYIQSIRQVQPEGPYRLAGWSAGGTVAYEMAHQLIGGDVAVEFLGMVDTDLTYNHLFPEVSHWNELAGREFDNLSLLVRSLPPTLEEEVEAQISHLQQAGDFDALLEYLREIGLIQRGIESGILTRHLKVRHAIRLALARYVPPLPSIVPHLFMAVDEPRVDRTIGWAGFVGEKLAMTELAGDHYSIMTMPNVKGLGMAISEALRARQGNAIACPESDYEPRVCIQHGQTGRVPLLCVPGAGASAAMFHELAQACDPALPVYAFQARGLDGALVPYIDVPTAARAYIRAAQELGPGPYHLLGHSFGGWVAFEMALQLVAAGAKVASLTLVDSRAPSDRASTTQKYSRIDALVRLIKLFNQRAIGALVELTAGDFAGLDHDTQLNLLHEHLVRAKIFSARAEPKMLLGILRVFEANLATRYTPARRYEGQLQFFDALEKDSRTEDAFTPWLTHAPQALRRTLPGNHMTMLNAPNVVQLGQYLITTMQQTHPRV